MDYFYLFTYLGRDYYRIHQGVVHKTPHTTMYAEYKQKAMRWIKGKPQDLKKLKKESPKNEKAKIKKK